MKTASVTELKNGLSSFLEKVQRGHSVLVTEHSRPVAILEKVSTDRLPPNLRDLAAQGLIALPGKDLDLKAFFSMLKAKGKNSLIEALSEDREGR